MPTSELEDNFKLKTLVAAEPSEGGIVASQSGFPAAAAFLKYEHRGKSKIIGVFIAEAGMPKIAGLPLYCEVHVSADAFEKKPTRGAQSVQDRQGLHTFVRGDIVEYTQMERGEVPPQACIYGCIEAEAVTDDPQARKILVLYDISADTFFFGTWPAWRRCPKAGDNQHVEICSHEVCMKMQASFALNLSSGVLSTIGTRHQVSE
jgi:hypothetical protein